MQCHVWLLAAAVDVQLNGLAHSLAADQAESALDARLIAANEIRLLAEPEEGEEEMTEEERQGVNYAAFVMSTIDGLAITEYTIPRHDCAKWCDETPKCEGFITEGNTCQMMASRDVVPGRSKQAIADNKAEFAYVKRKSLPMPHAKTAGFTHGWHGLSDASGRATAATLTNPWWSQTLPCNLDFDLKYSSMVTSITIGNAPDTVHRTGADQIEVFAKGKPDDNHPDGWIRIGLFRIFTGEQVTLPVEACHTRFVRVKFLTFHGDPGAVNITNIVLNGGIGMSPNNMGSHAADMAKRREMERNARKAGGMVECPLLRKYPSPTLAQLSTWAVHQSECMCGEVINQQTTGNTNAMVNDQINRWSAQVKSGGQFASEQFGPLYANEGTTFPADFHYTNNSDAWKSLKLNQSEWEAFKSAEKGGAPPPLKWFLFKPMGTRGKSRGCQIGGIHFQYRGGPVSMKGVRAHVLGGSVADGQGPENLFDDDPKTMYFNTVKDAAIVIEMPQQLIIDSFTITSADSKPDADPVLWIMQGGYDGVEWPFMLSEQEVDGPVPVKRETQSSPIKFKALLLAPETSEEKEEREAAFDAEGLNSISSWANIEYKLKEGEEHLYSERVPAQCLAMSCLSYAIATGSAGCQAHLKPICEEYAAITGCESHCDGSKKTSCVTMTRMSNELTDHWLAGSVDHAHNTENEFHRIHPPRAQFVPGNGLPADEAAQAGGDEAAPASLANLRQVAVAPSGQLQQ